MDKEAIINLVVQILTVMVSTGLLALLVKYGVNKVGDKLGWDEKKKSEWEALLNGVASKGIFYAEEAAKHQVFSSPEAQAKFKEDLAVKVVTETMGVAPDAAKVAVRAVFATSALAKPAKHNEVAKFKDETDPEKLINGGVPCVKP